MTKQEQKEILEGAARELKLLIDDVNVANSMKAERDNLDEPEFHDYQTCYELHKLSLML